MTKTNSSRDKLIAVAKALIVERGFSAMSVSTVCAAAKVTKGSFFHHFSSKDELGAVVLDTFWTDVLKDHHQAAYQSAENPLAALNGYIEHAIKTYQNPAFGGCLLAVFTNELKETHPHLYERSVPYFLEWKAEVEGLLDAAINYCRATKTIDRKTWAELYISTVEGALVLAKAENDVDIIARVLTLFRDLLNRSLTSSSS